MQHLVQVFAGDAQEGFLTADLPAPLPRHVDRHAQRRPAGPLAHPGLQHPQLALLDGELGVAHVPVVGLELAEYAHQLLEDPGETVTQRRQGQRVADPGHHVLALGVDQEVAVFPLVAAGRIAGEGDTGSGVVVAVAEHHGLHVDGSAEIMGNAFADPVGHGAGAVPGFEYGRDGAGELVGRLLGKGMAGGVLHDLLVGLAQVAEGPRRDLGITLHPRLQLGVLEGVVEAGPVDAQHDPPVHGDKAAVGVVGEALVTRLLRQPLDGRVVETEVEAPYPSSPAWRTWRRTEHSRGAGPTDRPTSFP